MDGAMEYVFESPSGVRVQRREAIIESEIDAFRGLEQRLNRELGIILSSGSEYPGQKSRWDIAVVSPPLELFARDNMLHLRPLSERGSAMSEILTGMLARDPSVSIQRADKQETVLHIDRRTSLFSEEERSLQPTVFTPLRSVLQEFRGIDDRFLGFYGTFGYDLIFEFEKLEKILDRPSEWKDLQLFFPDVIYVLDRRKEVLTCFNYEFELGAMSTGGLSSKPYFGVHPTEINATAEVQTTVSDQEFARLVDDARSFMRVGDVYELVLHRRFFAPTRFSTSEIYQYITDINPSPYQFLCQFGDEQIVGTSPEIFVQVRGEHIESCPISGTVRRGANAMEDADAIRKLLNSEKDEVELTMCTDVDRNDKARICIPGSVRLLERRSIERYSGLFHTVDRVEGTLRPEMTGLDAFLSHMWAVTLTGSPKPMAVSLIERMEVEPRRWYGGAVGALLLNGDVSTSIVIRAVHLEGGVASYRAGATLVYDSVGEEEEQETRTKATLFFRLIDASRATARAEFARPARPGSGLKILMIDNQDSFVHILADYFRQTDAQVVTYRAGLSLSDIEGMAPDLVVHSPGPRRPIDFGVPELVLGLANVGIPQFGVCLGLQGIYEAFGGQLGLLDAPRQGKRWTINHRGDEMFYGIPSPCEVGAYHALYADNSRVPDCIEVLACNENNTIMALRHRELPISAVQFHPESILTMHDNVGHKVVTNVVASLQRQTTPPRVGNAP